MKKYLCFFTKVHCRVIKKRTNRRIVSKLKKKESRGGVSRKKRKTKNTGRLNIVAPRILGFYDDRYRKEIMSWLKTLRNKATIGKVFIDFSQSKKPEATCVIRVLAEIDRLQQIYGQNRIRGNAPSDNIAAQALEQIGILKMIRSFKRATVSHKEVEYWRYTSGSQIDAENSGKMLEELLDINKSDENIITSLFNGITEAMTNVVMHAYDDSNKRWHDGEKKWWMFAGIKEKNLILIVCDVGIGIPSSLSIKHNKSIIDNIISSIGDVISSAINSKESKFIKVAMEIGRSSSNKSHRGLGMAQLKELIDTIKEGALFIHSNFGCYHYNYQQGGTSVEKLSDSSSSINGTIIGWKVPVSQLKFLSKGDS